MLTKPKDIHPGAVKRSGKLYYFEFQIIFIINSEGWVCIHFLKTFAKLRRKLQRSYEAFVFLTNIEY